MGAKQRFRNQFGFSVDHLALRHDSPDHFYLSGFQTGRSPIPVLCIRILLFLSSVGIVAFSISSYIERGFIAYWATYMTQWALLTICVSTGLGTAVSATAYFKGPVEAALGLPWLVKIYWMVYNIALPLSFFVTIFYYSFLLGVAPIEFDMNPVLDVLVHGINSVLMFVLMATTQQPIYFVQFVFPVGFLLCYLVFNLSYYWAGGTNPLGEPTIYPVVDWNNPGPTIGLAVACLGIMIGATTVAGLFSMLRDFLCRRWTANKNYSV